MRTAESRSTAKSLGEHALEYAREGWPVHPLRPRGKRPLTAHGLKDATTDLVQVRAWWSEHPRANIGLPVPLGFVVLDIDSVEALQCLRSHNLVLPSTAHAATGRGYHYWFSVGEDEVFNRVRLFEDVDVRAVGGYVVAPPSVHESGVPYRWKVTLRRASIAKAPAWLISALLDPSSGRPRIVADGPGAKPNRDVSCSQLILAGASEGQRNDALARVAGFLFRQLPPRVAADLACLWAKQRTIPALPDREIRRTIESIAQLEYRRRGGLS